MSQVPLNKPCTFRYIPDAQEDFADAKPFEGAYATVIDPPSNNTLEVKNIASAPLPTQKWQFVQNGQGVLVQLAPQRLPKGSGIGPEEIRYFWGNGSGSEILPAVTLTTAEHASTYQLNVVKEKDDGWIVA
ncbi:hypothetical protein RhiJN_21549 [Ceratobasidium sp. AG-Ba]|nr:hypothetical protein RhiJN_21549 [Ceratobasidium sp. AG-Ba]